MKQDDRETTAAGAHRARRPLLASGALAGPAGIGVRGLTGGLAALVVLVVSVVLVRHRRAGCGCTVHGPACGKQCQKS